MSNQYPTYFRQQSRRLQFRQLTIADIPAWTEFFVANDRLRFLGIDLSKSAEEHAMHWIETQLDRYKNQGLGHLAAELRDDGTFIGVGGIIPRELHGQQEYEIAYSLLPAYWGYGYGTELAQQMRRFGQTNIKTDRFVSIIDKENTDSIKVALKNGMYVLFDTRYLGMDVSVYGIEHSVH